MKREIIIGFMFIFILSFISANAPMPCALYGEVTHPNQTFPNGHFITAKINDVVSGECEIIDETYGYGGNTCIILSYQDNVNIKFYIGDKEIGEKLFENKEVVKVDFEVDFIPETSGNLSNGICEPELGECSFNILDCDSAITDACSGNGRCDVEIGEDCSNAPEDCGVCEYCGDDICNNGETCTTCPGDCGACPTPPPSSGGGSSGGGGGGGGSSYSSPSTTTSSGGGSGTSASSTNGGEGMINLNSSEDQIPTGPGITGAVIGFVKSSVGIGSIFAVLLLIAGIVVLTLRKKTPKQTPKE